MRPIILCLFATAGLCFSQNTDEATRHLETGNALVQRNQLDQAIAEYSEAIGLNPDSADAYMARANANLKLMHFEQALVDYSEAIRIKPDNPKALVERVSIYSRLNFNDRALADADEAIRLAPRNPGLYQWRAAIRSKLGDEAGAKADQAMAASIKPQRIRVGGGVQAASLVQKVDPVYPPLAVQARVQGTVQLNVTINGEGNVVNAQLVSGHPLLVNAAMEAVKQWKYKPTLLNGSPVEVVTQVEVPFALTN